MNQGELSAEKQRRLAFARAVYEATKGKERSPVDMWHIGRDLSFDRETTSRVVQYLTGEGLIVSLAIGGAIGITHRGVVEIESALDKPEVPTEHFPALNYIFVNEMHNSQIQQGSHGSVQHTVTSEGINGLKDYLREFRGALEGLPLSNSDKLEAKAELNTLEAQADSPKPKSHIIRASLTVLKDLLMHTAGAAGAHELLTRVHTLLSHFQ